MNLLRHLKKHQELYAVLVIALLARLLFFFDFHEIWWDSGVYLGMAKYLWSGGSAGLWEHIRPVLWPLIIGAAWWLKLNMVWFARALELLSSLVSIVLVYALGRKWFSQRAAVIASIAWAFSAIVFSLGFHEYTELPAVTLALAALLAFSNERWFLAGILTSLAFLMKFPAGIFLVVLGLVLLLQKRWKALLPFGIGFALPTVAFLVFNQVMYGTAFGPLIDARASILSVLGCNVLRYTPWYQYFIWIFTDNWLNVAALAGIAVVALRRKRQYVLPALALAIPALYLMQMHCREYRYLVLFLPLVSLFIGVGIVFLAEWLERRLGSADRGSAGPRSQARAGKRVWIAVVLLVVAVSVFHAVLFYQGKELLKPDFAAEQYYRWLGGRHIDGEIWSSNPVVSVYTDQPVQKLYYPMYEKGTAKDFNAYLAAHTASIGAVLLDNCGGGIVCPSGDTRCAEQLDVTRAFLNERFKQVFFAQSGNCWYAIYAH